MELRINSFFEKNTPVHTNRRKKPGLEALPFKGCKRSFIAHYIYTLHLRGKADEEPLSRAVYLSFYLSKIKDKQEKQVTHTYELIEAKIFMEATK